MKIVAKRAQYKLNSSNNISPDQLEKSNVIRVLNSERKFGQYKYIDNNQAVYFNNFLELRYFLRSIPRNKYVIISKVG